MRSFRFWPRSLQGQMLLAIALALLVAQSIGAALVWRAQVERSESSIAHALAFRIIGGALRSEGMDMDRRDARRVLRALRRGDEGPHPMRLVRGEDSGRIDDERDADLEERLAEILAAQSVEIAELEVFRRPVKEDPVAARSVARRLERDIGDPGPPRTVIVAAARLEAGDGWLIARTFDPPRDRGLGGSLILQTILIYVLLVGAVALLLRRITGPMSALTRRVEQFARDPTLPPDGQVAPQGPLDTRRLINAHNRMESRIGALLDEKDVMLGAIGHDLKTPLAALRVRIESVEDDAEREALVRTISDITNTLDDILSLARVGRPSDPVETTELSALVIGVVEEYEDMGENVELGDTQRVVLPLRATWVRRAMRNLVSNAVRYAGGAYVCTAKRDNQAIVRVEDEGPGIPENEIAFMMEPFQRGDPSRNRGTGGAGIGLTLARAIAEQHGGTLTLSNRTDGKTGLIAEIALPLEPKEKPRGRG
ncbi:sensor histidine kinase [Croceicoccus mobilis]|uniref:histidine kinase n=1 Tax=Croceicoccus mobilis TaxID=1703339 RepID=A0A917DUX8_9SPHN|nr:ATP-binding protein [Croceicoccus mobilis]GGD71244.1 two-component sensor histidine kinase [Croceicoccus mobilis]